MCLVCRYTVTYHGRVLHSFLVGYSLYKQVTANIYRAGVHGAGSRWVCLVQSVVDCTALRLAQNLYMRVVVHSHTGPRHHIRAHRAARIRCSRLAGVGRIVVVCEIGRQRQVTVGHGQIKVLVLRKHLAVFVSPVYERIVFVHVHTYMYVLRAVKILSGAVERGCAIHIGQKVQLAVEVLFPGFSRAVGIVFEVCHQCMVAFRDVVGQM